MLAFPLIGAFILIGQAGGFRDAFLPSFGALRVVDPFEYAALD